MCNIAQKEFVSDGCSMFPEGTWESCCVEHDKAYYKGGTYEDRKAADEALRKCLAKQGKPIIGRIMYIGVRLFGAPHWPTPYRWGYKYKYLSSCTYYRQSTLNT